MSDKRQSWSILSANKIARQKFDNFVGQDRTCSIFDDFVGQLFVDLSTNFVYAAMVIVYNGRRIFIFCYLLCLILIFVH